MQFKNPDLAFMKVLRSNNIPNKTNAKGPKG